MIIIMNTKTLKKYKKNKNYKKLSLYAILLSILLFFVILSMVVNPEKYIAVTLNSILIWATVVLPSIFPFLVYTKFLTKLKLVDHFANLCTPITRFLFNTDGLSSYIYIMSIMSGYPVGAKLTTDLYLEGKIDRGTAHRTICFCTNCGPMFIIGTVGVGLLLSKQAGYIILIAHLLGAIINGIVYRNYHKNDKKILKANIEQSSTDNFLSETAISSANSMFIVGTYIIVFFILIEFLNRLFSMNNTTILNALFNGFLEITHGAKDIALLPISMNFKIILSTAILSFGGIATAFQSFAFIKKIEYSFKFFFLQKLTHCIFSTIIACLLCLIL